MIWPKQHRSSFGQWYVFFFSIYLILMYTYFLSSSTTNANAECHNAGIRGYKGYGHVSQTTGVVWPMVCCFFHFRLSSTKY